MSHCEETTPQARAAAQARRMRRIALATKGLFATTGLMAAGVVVMFSWMYFHPKP